ncbi:MAG: hypothetical protein M3473_08030, partial [Chloroflexota bacterium]|nr:hypothetical protein [Chloroflexota bacterium]
MSRSLPPIMVIVAIALGACSGPPTATQPLPSIRASETAASPTTTPTPSDAPTSAETSVPSPTTEPEPEPEPLAWARLEADGPAAREDHTWTVDAEGTVAYLFGGRDGATVFDDIWAFDLRDDSWTQLAPAAPPEARFGHEAVWVDGIGLVVFSGQAGPSFFNDLWAYDPADEV